MRKKSTGWSGLRVRMTALHPMWTEVSQNRDIGGVYGTEKMLVLALRSLSKMDGPMLEVAKMRAMSSNFNVVF